MDAATESLLNIAGVGFAASLGLHLAFRDKRVRNLALGAVAPSLFFAALLIALRGQPGPPAQEIMLVALLMLPLGFAGALAGGAAAIAIRLFLMRD